MKKYDCVGVGRLGGGNVDDDRDHHGGGDGVFGVVVVDVVVVVVCGGGGGWKCGSLVAAKVICHGLAECEGDAGVDCNVLHRGVHRRDEEVQVACGM